MRPRTINTQAQEGAIQCARDVLQADDRVAACWLEGSFAQGKADSWSDVDLHAAIEDSAWESLFAERLDVLRRVGSLLGYGESGLPWGAHLIFATLAGPIRLDLYLEKTSRLDSAVRFETPKVLFDRTGVTEALRVTEDIDALIRLRLQELLRGFFFGAAWPVRLWGRREWGTMLMNAVAIVYQFLVPAILIQDKPRDFFRPQFHNERHLPPERRRAIDLLLGEILVAFRGIEASQPNLEALAQLHQRLISLIWSELRAACRIHRVAYPEDAEREMRDYYHRELGLEIPPHPIVDS